MTAGVVWAGWQALHSLDDPSTAGQILLPSDRFTRSIFSDHLFSKDLHSGFWGRTVVVTNARPGSWGHNFHSPFSHGSFLGDLGAAAHSA